MVVVPVAIEEADWVGGVAAAAVEGRNRPAEDTVRPGGSCPAEHRRHVDDDRVVFGR